VHDARLSRACVPSLTDAVPNEFLPEQSFGVLFALNATLRRLLDLGSDCWSGISFAAFVILFALNATLRRLLDLGSDCWSGISFAAFVT